MPSKSKNDSTLVRVRVVAAALLGMGAAAGPSWADTEIERSVTISNSGSEALELLGVSLSAGFVRGTPALNECGPTLAPGRHCEITIRFAPERVGPQTGTLSVSTNDPEHPTLVVELRGTGVADEHHDHDRDNPHRDHDGV